MSKDLARIVGVLCAGMALCALFAVSWPAAAVTPTPVPISSLPNARTVTPESLLVVVQGATPATYNSSVEAVVNAEQPWVPDV